MKKGFTMLELMFVVGVILLVIGMILISLVNCLTLNEHNRDLTLAINIGRERMESYRNTTFDNIQDVSFTSSNIEYLGGPSGFSCNVDVEYPDPDNLNLKSVRVAVCWRERGDRYIGEDDGRGNGEPLDGALALGVNNEDRNDNQLMDSPAVLTSAIARR